jgi:hypothetical protein
MMPVPGPRHGPRPADCLPPPLTPARFGRVAAGHRRPRRVTGSEDHWLWPRPAAVGPRDARTYRSGLDQAGLDVTEQAFVPEGECGVSAPSEGLGTYLGRVRRSCTLTLSVAVQRPGDPFEDLVGEHGIVDGTRQRDRTDQRRQDEMGIVRIPARCKAGEQVSTWPSSARSLRPITSLTTAARRGVPALSVKVRPVVFGRLLATAMAAVGALPSHSW